MNPTPAPTPAADPYAVVVMVTEHLAGRYHYPGPYTGRQFGEAAELAAALLAALGAFPAVSGDATHPRVLAGLALLDVLRSARRRPGSQEGCRE